MKSLLATSQCDSTVLSVDMPELCGGPATLYILNSGVWPPMPVIGDFTYNLQDFQHVSPAQMEKYDVGCHPIMGMASKWKSPSSEIHHQRAILLDGMWTKRVT